MTRAQGGYISGDNIPDYEYFYIGGINTIRGVDKDDVSPREFPNDPNSALVGGDRYGVLNLELTFPIGEEMGLYGVTFVAVMRRIPEMGVRMALGARPRDVVGLVLRQGLTRTAIGLGCGLALGWGLGKALESFLFQVRPEDPLTFAAIPLFLVAVSLLAYLVPARRASRVDPVEVLRSE